MISTLQLPCLGVGLGKEPQAAFVSVLRMTILVFINEALYWEVSF